MVVTTEIRLIFFWNYLIQVNSEVSPKQKGHETRATAEATLTSTPPLLHPPMGSWPRVTERFQEVGPGRSIAALPLTAKPALSSKDRVLCPLKATSTPPELSQACQSP